MADFEINDRRLKPRDGAIEEEEKGGQAEGGSPKSEEKAGSSSGSPDAGPPKDKPEDSPKDKPPSSASGASASSGAPPPQKEKPAPEIPGPDPEVDFSTLVIGFSSAALLNMGEAPPEINPKPPKDLKAAKHFIDILGMLEKKTEGNLTDSEAQLLKALLFDLRMKFVAVSKKA